VKHIPIIGKILSILVAFGLFVISTSFYTAGGMRLIANRYTHLTDHQAEAALYLARSGESLATIRASIAEFMISTMDASNQADLAAINVNEQNFGNEMDKAATLDRADAAAIRELKQHDTESIDNGCLNAVNQGLNAMDDPSMLSAQAVFLKECSPIFPSLTRGITVEANRIADEVHTDADCSAGADRRHHQNHLSGGFRWAYAHNDFRRLCRSRLGHRASNAAANCHGEIVRRRYSSHGRRRRTER
jgi:methyl-accepting chemotaxis protein